VAWPLKKSARRAQQPAPLERQEWTGVADITLVPVSKVIVPEGTPEPDPVLVANIAETIQALGLIHPIATRLHVTRFDRSDEIILVDGAARLAAYKLLGEKTVPCVYFPDDEVATKFIQLSESLFRKPITALERADQVAELVEFIDTHQLGILGQNVSKRGRPPGKAARAAKVLPIEAKTLAARQKQIERNLMISKEIWWQNREHIKAKHLDNNQAYLLEIAREPDADKQFEMIQRLGRRRKTLSTVLQERRAETMPADEQRQYEELPAAYDASPQFRTAWRRASKEHRERFINEVLRGSSGYDADEAVAIIQRAFAGREKIYVRDLIRYGARYGLHKTTVRRVVRALGYKKKRGTRDRRSPWYYVNDDWKKKFPVISDDEFKDHSPYKPREDDDLNDNDIDLDDDNLGPRQYKDRDKDLDSLDD
jgi:ParB-like chromosome segregation protein Spo0J